MRGKVITMQIPINESDWKLFRQKLPDWQEAYIDRLNREYVSLLAGAGTASDKFWELEKRINSDKHRTGVDARMSRSNMYHRCSPPLKNAEQFLYRDNEKRQIQPRQNHQTVDH